MATNNDGVYGEYGHGANAGDRTPPDASDLHTNPSPYAGSSPRVDDIGTVNNGYGSMNNAPFGYWGNAPASPVNPYSGQLGVSADDSANEQYNPSGALDALYADRLSYSAGAGMGRSSPPDDYQQSYNADLGYGTSGNGNS